MFRAFEAKLRSMDAADFFQHQRWYQHKGELIRGIEAVDAIELAEGIALLLCRFKYDHAQTALYAIPFDAKRGEIDCSYSESYLNRLFAGIATGTKVRGGKGYIMFESLDGRSESSSGITFEHLDVSSTNTLVCAHTSEGDVLLKMIRRLEEGTNVEAEVNAYLSSCTNFQSCPRLLATIRYRGDNGETYHLASAFKFIPRAQSGWDSTLNYLAEKLSEGASKGFTGISIAPYVERMKHLGREVAFMHLAMGGDPAMTSVGTSGSEFVDREKFQWKNIAKERATAIQMRVASTFERVMSIVDAHRNEIEGLDLVVSSRNLLSTFIDRIPETLQKFGVATRQHGDFHLGQFMIADEKVYFIDFEGEPLRSAKERSMAMPIVMDVAGMVRSFNYASFAAWFAFRDQAGARKPDEAALKKARAFCEMWEDETRRAFVDAYLDTLKNTGSIPVPFEDRKLIDATLAIFVLEKAMYELEYEVRNRPDWVAIPIGGITNIIKMMK